jgi:hypothetical protein
MLQQGHRRELPVEGVFQTRGPIEGSNYSMALKIATGSICEELVTICEEPYREISIILDRG